MKSKVIKKFEFPERSIGESKYPWDEWLDGRIHELSLDDGEKADTVRSLAYSQARRRGMTVKVAVTAEGKAMVVQASKMTAEQLAERDRQDAERKAKAKAKRAEKAAEAEQAE